jgi:acetate kinase
MGKVLVLNAGSSSLKVAVLPEEGPAERVTAPPLGHPGTPGFETGYRVFLRGLIARVHPIEGIGHRVVHGGARFDQPTRITPGLLEELRRLSPLDPEHLPLQVSLISIVGEEFPEIPQVACFDTAFHRALPRVSQIIPIPRKYEAAGIRRYGFHGLSYSYIVGELGLGAGGRTVIAHLGSGASLAAVLRGKCVDTTMAFTPASGIPMSRRSGDLDPGLVEFLAKTEGMSASQFQRMVNTESGLLGISETSADVRELLAREGTDPRAQEALAVFCYSVKKTIGAYAAALGGLETLVFSGGIGENSSVLRGRICEGLEFLGVELDPEWNNQHRPVISKGRVTVRVIKTDEEAEIARATRDILRRGNDRQR